MHARGVGFNFAAVKKYSSFFGGVEYWWNTIFYFFYFFVIVETRAKPAPWLSFSSKQFSHCTLRICDSQTLLLRLSSPNHKTFPSVGTAVTEPAMGASLHKISGEPFFLTIKSVSVRNCQTNIANLSNLEAHRLQPLLMITRSWQTIDVFKGKSCELFASSLFLLMFWSPELPSDFCGADLTCSVSQILRGWFSARRLHDGCTKVPHSHS